MDGVHRPSPTSLPVMFFGTLEIAWISPTETCKWQDGIKAKMHTKPKGRKAFDIALQQVFLASHTMLWRLFSEICLPFMQHTGPGSLNVQARAQCSISVSQSDQVLHCAGSGLCSIKEVATELVVQEAPTAQTCWRSCHCCRQVWGWR